VPAGQPRTQCDVSKITLSVLQIRSYVGFCTPGGPKWNQKKKKKITLSLGVVYCTTGVRRLRFVRNLTLQSAQLPVFIAPPLPPSTSQVVFDLRLWCGNRGRAVEGEKEHQPSSTDFDCSESRVRENLGENFLKRRAAIMITIRFSSDLESTLCNAHNGAHRQPQLRKSE
jgi:hypothetical protein